MNILPQPELVPMVCTDNWQLSENFTVLLPVLRKRLFLHNGFVTDGASVPKFFWRIVGHPMTGDYVAPALVHDLLYRGMIVPRHTADLVFRELLRRNGRRAASRARLLYWAVRLFGWRAYGRGRWQDVEAARMFCRIEEIGTMKEN